MYDKDTVLACIEELERITQEHPDAGAALILWNLKQMLDRTTDRWNDGFSAGISSRVDTWR